MKKPDRIVLDMDGVLCDFVAGVAALFSVPKEVLMARWEPGSYDVFVPLHVSEQHMWEVIQLRGFPYWAYLPPYPWADELWALCNTIAPTTIVTAPSYDSECAIGKMEWLQDHFGENFRSFLIGPAKEACASPSTLLIDDSDKNCELFEEYGGQSLLFPRHWNSLHAQSDRALDYIKEVLLP